MTVLILDTSGDKAYVAIAQNGILITQIVIPDGKLLSKFLLTSIETILQGYTIDSIAIGIGPGSFTGTRIGAIVAKTLAFAWKIPLISFSSSLLPDLNAIAASTYPLNTLTPQIELVYISPRS